MDNFVDNQGIRSGLEKVTLQLVETNKKLDEQNKPNLVKAFQENQAEVFATYFTAKQQMQQQEVIASSVVSGVGTVKTPKTAGGQQTSNLPSEDDTLYGLMFKLLQVTIEKNEADAIEKAARQETAKETLRGLTEGQKTLKRTIQKQIDDLQASNVEWGTMGAQKTEERIYSLERKLEDLKDIQRNNLKEAIAARKERQKERKKEEDFKKAQFSFSTQFKKGLFGVSDSLSAKGTFGSLLKDKLMGLGGVFKKGIGKLGFGLGKLALGIVSIGSKIMGGFKALGKKFGELFMKFLGGIGFALKTIGAILLIGGLYKFLSSETWQKMKPNIAESIGKGLEIADSAVRKVAELIQDYLLPALMGLYNFVIKTLDFLGIIRKGKKTYMGEEFDEETEKLREKMNRFRDPNAAMLFGIDLIGKENREDRLRIANELEKQIADRERNRTAMINRQFAEFKERKIAEMMKGGYSRPEAEREFIEDYEGHIAGVGFSNIGFGDTGLGTGGTGTSGTTTIANATSQNVSNVSTTVMHEAIVGAGYMSSTSSKKD